jgi:membrane protein DedA with SNARE-associated domain
MSPLPGWALEWVSAYGPWFVLLMTFAETGFLIGLILPAGPTIVLGTVLAVQGHFSVWWVFAFTALGGTLGDHLGFFWGRRAGRHVLRSDGRLARAAQRHWGQAEELFGRHPIYAVSFARLISFVRTLMPLAAGTSQTTYRAFAFYDLLGIAGWSTAHILVGYLAGESWQQMVRLMGIGWTAVFVLLGGALWLVHRRRTGRSARTRNRGADA